MILLGLLLMAACAALAVDAVVQNGHVVQSIAFDQRMSDLTLGAVFVAGAVTGLLFALGLLMFTGGVGRSGRKRRERRLAARQAAAENAALREHNERLEAALQEGDAQRAPHGSATAEAAPAYPAEADGATERRFAGRHRS